MKQNNKIIVSKYNSKLSNNRVTLQSARHLFLVSLVFVMAVLLFIGCSVKSSTKVIGSGASKEKEVASIEVIRTSDKKIWHLTDSSTITKFMKALNNRVEMKGEIDIREKDFTVIITYTDETKDENLLWTENDPEVYGILMIQNKAYTIDKSSNAVFYEILK